jgi:hypothetical protein
LFSSGQRSDYFLQKRLRFDQCTIDASIVTPANKITEWIEKLLQIIEQLDDRYVWVRATLLGIHGRPSADGKHR